MESLERELEVNDFGIGGADGASLDEILAQKGLRDDDLAPLLNGAVTGVFDERRKFMKMVSDMVLFDTSTDLTQEKIDEDGIYKKEEANITLEKLFNGNKELMKQWAKAVREERNDIAFRRAVFLNSLRGFRGKPFRNKVVMFIAGPSSSGKTFLSTKAIEMVIPDEEDTSSTAEPGELLFLSVDGGITRETSQMRSFILSTALAKGFSGITDLDSRFGTNFKHEFTDCILESDKLNAVIPSTFVNPKEKDVLKRFEDKEYKDHMPIHNYMVEIGSAEIVIERYFKAAVNLMGNSRAWSNEYGEPLPIDERTQISLNAKPKVESKKYQSGNFELGVKKSNSQAVKFSNKFGMNRYIKIANDRVFAVQDGNTVRILSSEDDASHIDNGLFLTFRQFRDYKLNVLKANTGHAYSFEGRLEDLRKFVDEDNRLSNTEVKVSARGITEPPPKNIDTGFKGRALQIWWWMKRIARFDFYKHINKNNIEDIDRLIELATRIEDEPVETRNITLINMQRITDRITKSNESIGNIKKLSRYLRTYAHKTKDNFDGISDVYRASFVAKKMEAKYAKVEQKIDRLLQNPKSAVQSEAQIEHMIGKMSSKATTMKSFLNPKYYVGIGINGTINFDTGEFFINGLMDGSPLQGTPLAKYFNNGGVLKLAGNSMNDYMKSIKLFRGGDFFGAIANINGDDPETISTKTNISVDDISRIFKPITIANKVSLRNALSSDVR